MKKLLATAATLLLAFGSVALSTNIATADEAPAVEVVTEATSADDTTEATVEEPAVTQEEPPATEEPPAAEEQAPAEQVAEVTQTEIASEPEVTTGTDPPVETASSFVAESVESLDADFVGVTGVLLPWSSATNHEDYWEDYTDHEMQCFKHGGSSDHGSVTDGGKTVTLNEFNQDWWGDHWELLVIKGGNVWNNVIEHPKAGTAYASTENAGGNQANVSHWIVCKGVQPDVDPEVAKASVKTTPGTCEAEGAVVVDTAENAEFGEPVYANHKYTIVATATGDALFDVGDGVSDDRKTKTFTGDLPPQNTELCEGTVSYCHAMPADTAANGWELKSNMPVQSVNGHKEHAADIIPPVPGILPAGLNWDASFEVNGVELTAQEILRLGCDFHIEKPNKPTKSDEYCYDGETQDGSITVDFGDLGDKVQFRITGGAGVNILIEYGDSTTAYLPAGDYTVTAEAVAPYEFTGDAEWDFTIGSAINCECVVDEVDKVDDLSIVENPECAEAEVSVKPATCEAAASLVLGDTLHATFGEPVIENGTYTVVATADDGYRFFPGEGVSEDGSTKTFEGALAPKKTVCGDLTTLSLPNTGGGTADGALWLGVFAIGLGVTGVLVATRRAAAKR